MTADANRQAAELEAEAARLVQAAQQGHADPATAQQTAERAFKEAQELRFGKGGERS